MTSYMKSCINWSLPFGYLWCILFVLNVLMIKFLMSGFLAFSQLYNFFNFNNFYLLWASSWKSPRLESWQNEQKSHIHPKSKYIYTYHAWNSCQIFVVAHITISIFIIYLHENLFFQIRRTLFFLNGPPHMKIFEFVKCHNSQRKLIWFHLHRGNNERTQNFDFFHCLFFNLCIMFL